MVNAITSRVGATQKFQFHLNETKLLVLARKVDLQHNRSANDEVFEYIVA